MKDEVIDGDIYKNYEYKGKNYHVEVFHLSDHTFKAAATNINVINDNLIDEPIGIGSDATDSTRAIIQAIKDLNTQYS